MTRPKRQPPPIASMRAGLIAFALTFVVQASNADPASEATQPPAATAVAPAASAPNPADELVCKRVRETGSNISHKVCRTRAQIEAESESATEVLERSRRGANGGRLDEGG